MMNQKAKEPLVAVMLSIFIPGLGHVYANKFLRGVVFFVLNGLDLVLLAYIFNPSTRINAYLLLLVVLWPIFYIIFSVDAYRCAKFYNSSNNLTREINFSKRLLLIVGISFFCLFNFDSIVDKFTPWKDIKRISISSNLMNPTLIFKDMVLVQPYKDLDPQKGDIVLVEYNGPKGIEHPIKRLIAGPGESVEVVKGKFYVDGQTIEYPEIKDKDYSHLDYSHSGGKIAVPEGFYFLLDNRTGMVVKRENLKGRVYKIFFPVNRMGAI